MADIYVWQLNNEKRGFTLIEIIIAMMILAIISVGLLGNFFSSPPKARDAKRKQSLRQIQNALEVYYNDNDEYPSATNGQISCEDETKSWGDEFDCYDEVYMKKLPTDPGNNTFYYFRTSDQQGYMLYALLENENDSCFSTDQCCLLGFDDSDCSPTSDTQCNYVVTSPNESAGGLSCSGS